MVIKLTDTSLAKEIIESESEINKKADKNISKARIPTGVNINQQKEGQFYMDMQNGVLYFKGSDGSVWYQGGWVKRNG